MSISELIREIQASKLRAQEQTGTEAINTAIAIMAMQDSLIKRLLEVSMDALETRKAA